MRIVVIRFSSLGDCALLCPFLEHLKQQGATVTVVTKRDYVDLFAAANGVDRIVALEAGSGWRGIRQVVAAVGDTDAVIDAHNTLRSRIVARSLGGAAARFEKNYARKLGLIWLKRPGALPPMSQSYSALAEQIGMPPIGRTAGGITVPRAVRERVREKLAHITTPYLVMAPGGRWAMKRWGGGKYFALARRIASDYRYHIVLLGDRDDAELTAGIAASLGDSVTDLAGRASILESAGVIQGAVGFVGNDSGLMHLSEAVGVPVVAVFGPTVAGFGYFPTLEQSLVVERQIACRPCSRNGARRCPKGTHECMTGITVDMVADAFDRVAGKPLHAREMH